MLPVHIYAADRYWVGGTDTWNATANTKWASTSGGAGGETVPSTTDNCYFDELSGTSTVTVTIGATVSCGAIDFTGFTGTLAGSSALNISGGLTLDPGMTNTYTGAITFNGNSSTNITSNNVTLLGSLTFNNASGTWTLADNLTTATSSLLTLTSGTFDANGHDVTLGTFLSSNSSVRTLIMGGGQWTLGGSGTVWNTGTQTNFNFQLGNLPIIANYNGAVSRTFAPGTWHTAATAPSFNITAGTGQVSMASGNSFGSLDFTGFTGEWRTGGAGRTIFGNLTFDPGMTVQVGSTHGTRMYPPANTTVYLETNGVQFNASLSIGDSATTSGTVVLNDDLSATNIIFGGGTFDVNNHNIFANQGFYLTQSSISGRVLKMGSGTWRMKSWVNIMTTPNIDVQTDTSTVVLDNTVYSGNLSILQSNTFYNLETNVTGSTTLLMASGTTQTILNSLSLQGDSVEKLTITSADAPNMWNIDPQRSINLSNIILQDSNNLNSDNDEVWQFTGVVDGGNNTGWIFTEPVAVEGGQSSSSGCSARCRAINLKKQGKIDEANSLLQEHNIFIDNVSSSTNENDETDNESIIKQWYFPRNLSLLMTGADVQDLQRYLNLHGYTVSVTGAGSLGEETEYFGLLTFDALIRFQEANSSKILTPLGLNKGTGYFGTSTRQFIQ